ncbi:EpsG family protein [Ruegeria sp. R14_0]|uniref:EpsG family protein n=1 Tax=Ruegeria sp. R14_0 TaxID=2821100 RepID=UPI001FFDFEEF|nr:EpsG family protein [Ruegeria sp. R14_0]
MLVFFGMVLSLFIGLRFEVGKDWVQYNYLYEVISDEPFIQAVGVTDLGYSLINWLSYQIGFGIAGVFLFCAIVLAVGIVMFALRTPYPWIAVAATMPHIVTVMAMDHVRQATALGIILIGLAYLDRRKVWTFLACIVLAALFHRTAIILMGFGVVLVSKNRALLYPTFLAIAAIVIQYMLSDRLDIYSSRYLESEAGSRGALLRLFLNALPAAGFLVIQNRLNISPQLRKVLVLMAWAAVICFVAMPLSPSTVVVDRIGKYFLPVQIFFFSYFVTMFYGAVARAAVALLIVSYLMFTQVYWLAKSDLAQNFWVPYKMVGF